MFETWDQKQWRLRLEGWRERFASGAPPAPDRDAIHEGDLVQVTVPLKRKPRRLKGMTRKPPIETIVNPGEIVTVEFVNFIGVPGDFVNETMEWRFYTADGRFWKASWEARLVRFTVADGMISLRLTHYDLVTGIDYKPAQLIVQRAERAPSL